METLGAVRTPSVGRAAVISGPSDVINSGSLVMAYMLGNPNDYFTVNGVTFA